MAITQPAIERRPSGYSPRFSTQGPVFKTTGWLQGRLWHLSEVDQMRTRKSYGGNGYK